MCQVNKYIHSSHKYNTTAITFKTMQADSTSYAASGMVITPTHNNMHRASDGQNTAHADCPCKILEDITRLLACILPGIILTESESVFLEEPSVTDRKI